MLVHNVFELINKFDKVEDQISAGFGFLLQNHPALLRKFLQKIRINPGRVDTRQVDIETQVAYDAEKSRIDLQIVLGGEFLVFLESKLYSTHAILEQLRKYWKVLREYRDEYARGVRLVYVNRNPLQKREADNLRQRLHISREEFFVFSWEDLIEMTWACPKRETIALFQQYIGETMYSKRIMKDQKIKDAIEVLVLYTNPAFWALAQKKRVAVQGRSAPEAHYIAFLRTHRGNGKRSAITHIAQVEYTESNVPPGKIYRGVPEVIKFCRKRGDDFRNDKVKKYAFRKIVKLAREIPHLRGEGAKAQVRFGTIMSELLRVKSVGQIKPMSRLKR